MKKKKKIQWSSHHLYCDCDWCKQQQQQQRFSEQTLLNSELQYSKLNWIASVAEVNDRGNQQRSTTIWDTALMHWCINAVVYINVLYLYHYISMYCTFASAGPSRNQSINRPITRSSIVDLCCCRILLSTTTTTIDQGQAGRQGGKKGALLSSDDVLLLLLHARTQLICSQPHWRRRRRQQQQRNLTWIHIRFGHPVATATFVCSNL